MKYSRTVKLKNGTDCVIRSCTKQDAEAVLNSFLLTHAQTDHLLTYPDENTFTVDEERQFLSDAENSNVRMELCAVVGGRIVGTAGFEPVGMREKIRHRADIGISVEKEYWGLGIGKALMTACIDGCRSAGFSQIELQVVADNHRAVHMYESLGFREYGRNPKGFRSRVSGWQELIYMCMDI